MLLWRHHGNQECMEENTVFFFFSLHGESLLMEALRAYPLLTTGFLCIRLLLWLTADGWPVFCESSVSLALSGSSEADMNGEPGMLSGVNNACLSPSFQKAP